MKKYYIKKWPWWKFWLKDIYGIAKEFWIRDLGGKIVSGIIYEFESLHTESGYGWIVPKGYYKEVKND